MALSAAKPTVGRLVLMPPMGRAITLESNKPFAVLQKLKKEYIMRGYRKESLKITY